MGSRLRRSLLIVAHVFDRIRRADDLGGPGLARGRPHGQAGEEAAVGDFELLQGIGDIAS